jgi:hypothetical protein
MPTRILPLALAGAVILVAAPAAEAKKKKPRLDATYLVTVKAEMKEQWSFRDYSNYDCTVGAMCAREQLGSGSASAHLKTRRPFPLMVIRGGAGRTPILNHGSDGIPMTGTWLRGGTMTTTYSGHWDAGNPDTAEPTDGCGNRTEKDFATVGWSYDEPWHLQLHAASEPLRDGCPDGPPSALDWEGDESPALSDVLARVGKGKFLGTKQFTVRGTRSWTGTVPATNRTDAKDTKIVNGQKTVTWSWEATFRMKGAKRKHRRH